jgi:hypothetical protein
MVDHRFTVRVSEFEKYEILRICKEREITPSALLRLFVRDGLAGIDGINLSEIQSQNTSILDGVEALKVLVSATLGAAITPKVGRYSNSNEADMVAVDNELSDALKLGAEILEAHARTG